MRITFSFFEERRCARLKPKECIIRVNSRESMLRVYLILDGRLTYLTSYARAGEKWSREVIADWLRTGLRIDLDEGIYKRAA